MQRLFSKGPDGRYILETLILAILLPLLFLVVIFAFLQYEFRVLLALIGIFLFWILWIPPIWKGRYYERIPSRNFEVLYQISASSLTFLYAFAVMFALSDLLQVTFAIANWTLLGLSVFLSYLSGYIGNKIVSRLSFPRDRWANKIKVDEHSPYAYLLRAVISFFILSIIVITFVLGSSIIKPEAFGVSTVADRFS